MTWQEYQEAVALLYEQAEGFGQVKRNVYIPDKITGQNRQIDVLIELTAKGHQLNIIIDAKFRKEKLDVKDIEEVVALAEAVRANHAVIVATNGWTQPAEIKAQHIGIELRILTLEAALGLIVPEKWEICPRCEVDVIVNDHGGMLQFYDGMILWWLGGQCRNCKLTAIWCQDCGQIHYFDIGEKVKCYCGHTWSCNSKGMRLKLQGASKVIYI